MLTCVRGAPHHCATSSMYLLGRSGLYRGLTSLVGNQVGARDRVTWCAAGSAIGGRARMLGCACVPKIKR